MVLLGSPGDLHGKGISISKLLFASYMLMPMYLNFSVCVLVANSVLLYSYMCVEQCVIGIRKTYGILSKW